MKRLLPLAALVLAVTTGGLLTILPATGLSPSPSETPTATTAPPETPTPSPTGTPAEAIPRPLTKADATPIPGPWAPPPGYAGALRPDMWVQITGTESCLNARVVPGLVVQGYDGTEAPVAVLNCLPDGFVGRLGGGTWFGEQPMPQQADGHWWWHLLGQGWVAEDWLAPVSGEPYPYPPRPDLAAAGLVAYVNAGDIWLMNADGAAPRKIRELQESTAWVTSLRWSPDGSRLAVSVTISGLPEYVTTWLLTTEGQELASYPGIADATWSPDGSRISGIRVNGPYGLGGYAGTPVIIDIASGAETQIPVGQWTGAAPAWSPDGSSVALVCFSGVTGVYGADGVYREEQATCPAGDGLQVVSLATLERRLLVPVSAGEAYLSAPNWSPDGQTIAVSMSGLQSSCEGYAHLSVADGSVRECFTLPEFGAGPQRCGGSLDAGATDWSADGRIFAYHWQYRQGANGVTVRDLWNGSQLMIPSMDASNVSLSPDGNHLVFTGSGYIWTANTDGKGLSLLAEGTMPAWQPSP